MGIFRDDSSSLHQPLPLPILVAIGAVVLVLATNGYKSIIASRERDRATQELNEGRLTIIDVLQYTEQNKGKWPKQWSDLKVDRNEKISLNFTLTLEELSQKPYLIYSAIELKQRPELQDKLKPDLDEFRLQLMDQLSKRPK